MKLWKKLLALGLALLLLPATGRALEETPAPAEPAYNGWIVKLREDRPRALSDLPQTSQQDLEVVTDNLLRTQNQALAQELVDRGVAEYMEPDYIATLCDLPAASPTATPCDGLWSYQDLQGDYADGLGLTGRGVTIAVIDSGYAPTANLAARSVLEGWNYVNPGQPMTDNVGHGTMVLQTIVGRGDMGACKGTAPDAKVLPLRCFADGFSTQASLLITAIEDAVNRYDCQVLNMSWMIQESKALEEALLKAQAKGMTLVAAAGNTGSYPSGCVNFDTIVYPAAYSCVLGVGATNCAQQLWEDGVRAVSCSVTAPGENIVFSGKLAGSVVRQTGTSFAAPAVSGVAALLHQLCPGISNQSVQEALIQRAEPQTWTDGTKTFPFRRVRLEKLLGTSWGHLSPQEAEGWLRQPGKTVLAASYSSSGQLVDCQLQQSHRAISGFSLPLTEGSAQTKLFWLDGAQSPLLPCTTFPQA